jgi:hypothetical protein
MTTGKRDFQTVFSRLRRIMKKYEPRLVVKSDAPGDYTLDSPVLGKNRQAVFFGAVQIRKSYVSYHLMPVYVFPDLLREVSHDLKKRMQGKSCFNFTAVNESMFNELARLTQSGYKRFRQAKLA